MFEKRFIFYPRYHDQLALLGDFFGNSNNCHIFMVAKAGKKANYRLDASMLLLTDFFAGMVGADDFLQCVIFLFEFFHCLREKVGN